MTQFTLWGCLENSKKEYKINRKENKRKGAGMRGGGSNGKGSIWPYTLIADARTKVGKPVTFLNRKPWWIIRIEIKKKGIFPCCYGLPLSGVIPSDLVARVRKYEYGRSQN